MNFTKYHGLGNDYLVIEANEISSYKLSKLAKTICDRNYGIGADGILVGPYNSSIADFKVRIINPDGSEAEKSGNGLRIFSRYLWDKQHSMNRIFTIETAGGKVTSEVFPQEGMVRVEMGQVSFNSIDIGTKGSKKEVIREFISIDGREFTFCVASVGNPHCIIINENPTKELVYKFGPKIENNPRFKNRINVQFLKVIDNSTIEIQIWERGAGYTFSSGSSSTAAAAVAHKLGLCGSQVKVIMPGGMLKIEFDSNMKSTMIGPVVKVAEGFIDKESLVVS